MVVDDEAEVCVNSYGNEDVVFEYLFFVGKEDSGIWILFRFRYFFNVF